MTRMTKGCLIIHGLTGTPGTVSIIRERLMAKGFHVATPCLAGHGGGVEDLASSTWREWYETVRIAFGALRKEVDKVYFAGISLGALLGLKLAIDEGSGIRALALMSTPLKLSLSERVAISTVRYSPLKWIVRAVPKDLKKSVGDKEGRRRYNELSLPMIPSSTIFELADLQKEVLAGLKKISNPILILHGKGDHVAPVSNVAIIKKSVASDVVESVIFPKSRHVITMDIEKERVANSVLDFFERFL